MQMEAFTADLPPPPTAHNSFCLYHLAIVACPRPVSITQEALLAILQRSTHLVHPFSSVFLPAPKHQQL